MSIIRSAKGTYGRNPTREPQLLNLDFEFLSYGFRCDPDYLCGLNEVTWLIWAYLSQFPHLKTGSSLKCPLNSITIGFYAAIQLWTFPAPYLTPASWAGDTWKVIPKGNFSDAMGQMYFKREGKKASHSACHSFNQ